jgi:pyrrolidone-carboxylate peptidase
LPEKPVLVVSLGEGDCDFRLETAVTNLDESGTPDNAGQTREGQIIDGHLPTRIGLTLPLDRMFCERPQSAAAIVPSISAGSFVCNNTAFRLAPYFLSEEVSFGFIHVPQATCKKQKLDDNARVVAALIGSALKAAPVAAPWPTDFASAKAQLGEAQDSCEQDFLQRLIGLYTPKRRPPVSPDIETPAL